MDELDEPTLGTWRSRTLFAALLTLIVSAAAIVPSLLAGFSCGIADRIEGCNETVAYGGLVALTVCAVLIAASIATIVVVGIWSLVVRAGAGR